MARAQYANNATSKLTSAITSGSTSLVLTTSSGALFPTPSGGNYFYVTLSNTAGTAVEICLCTARSGDTLTVTRGQDGTTAQAFAINDIVELRVTAAVLSELATKTDPETLSSKTFQSYKENISTAVTTIAGTVAANIDVSSSNIFDITLNNTSSCTFTFINPPGAGLFQQVTVILTQGAGGSKLATFANASYTDGVAPVLATAAGKIDTLSFWTKNGGTNWYGSYNQANM